MAKKQDKNIDHAKTKKVIGITGIILLCLNLIFFSFRVYSEMIFWIALGVIAVLSFVFLRLFKQ